MKRPKSPLTVFTLGLGLFGLAALGYNFRLEVLIHTGLVLGGVLFGYGVLTYLQPKLGHLKGNTLVTGVIAVLLLNPPFTLSSQSLAWLFAGGILVILSKLGPRYKHRIIFNPAAFGLILLSGFTVFLYGKEAILPTFISWWGTDFGGLYALVILLPLVSYATYKFKKFYLVLTFLLFNALWLLWTENFEAVKYVYSSGTIYFIAGVMLLEPKTSPVNTWWQIGAGLLAVFVYRTIGSIGFNNTELWAVIAVNLVHLLSRLGVSKMRKNLKN